MYDAPKRIRPKFANDITTVEMANYIRSIQTMLQAATNEIKQWTDKQGLEIILLKTKLMASGSTPSLDVQIGEIPIKKTEKLNQTSTPKIVLNAGRIEKVDLFQ